MSYVGKMPDLIELYLAELERDGIDTPFGTDANVARLILIDFAQWLEDDVQDIETTPEGNDEVWEDHQRWLEATGEELNLTGFGDVVGEELSADITLVDDAAGIENWDLLNQEALDKACQLKAQQFLDSLRYRSVWGYLSARAQNEIESEFGEDSTE